MESEEKGITKEVEIVVKKFLLVILGLSVVVFHTGCGLIVKQVPSLQKPDKNNQKSPGQQKDYQIKKEKKSYYAVGKDDSAMKTEESKAFFTTPRKSCNEGQYDRVCLSGVS